MELIFRIFEMKKTLYITNKLFFANWFVPVIGAVLIQVIGIIVSRRLVVKLLPDDYKFNLYIALLLFVPILASILLFLIYFKKSDFTSLGFTKDNNVLTTISGFITGSLLMFFIYICHWLSGFVEISSSNSFSFGPFFFLFLAYFIQSLTEEILFRGYVMTTVTKFKGSFAGVLCNSMLFSFIHFRNYGITAIALFNLFLLGIIFSILFNMTQNILFVTGVHTTWNFTMGCVLGNKVSGGYSPVSLFRITENSSFALWNGGDFGFEGGVLCSLILVGCLAYFSLERVRVSVRY
ncbi:CPBP family intramembrane metalloprotease [Streptococcus agalactiae]|nr:CPBP family intramembrane metalloprotease [Streptococcus agalactiae]